MKRVLCVCLACLMLMACPLSASATVLTQVTDYSYASMQTGGVEGSIVYTAHDESGALVMGTLTADGEQTRQAHTFAAWDSLFAPKLWKTTVHHDGTPLCPYGSSHAENTICPYMELACVTLENTETGVRLENYYIPSGVSQILPGTNIHFCFGRYGYKGAETMRWDGESRYFSVKNADGLWGVLDSASNTMVTDFVYTDISAVYGSYVKVFDGTAWGRLDLSGRFVTQFLYESADAFSVRDEVREVANGQWQIFNKDNEAISPVIEGAFLEATYIPTAALLLVRNVDKTWVLYDIEGNVTASFTAAEEVDFLQDNCFAVSRYTESGVLRGIALYRADDMTTAADLVEKGDVNFDGAINSIDARLALRTVLGQGALTAKQEAAADVSENGTVDSADVRGILRLATA